MPNVYHPLRRDVNLALKALNHEERQREDLVQFYHKEKNPPIKITWRATRKWLWRGVKCIIVAIVVWLFVVAAFSAPARADEVYNYTGPLFSGSFTVPDALAPTDVRTQVFPDSFSFTWGSQKFTDANVLQAFFFFAIAPDGSVATWFFDLVKQNNCEIDTRYFGSAAEATEIAFKGNKVTSTQGIVGTWTHHDPPSTRLAVVATPEPSTLFLMCGALFFFALAAPKRRRREYGE